MILYEYEKNKSEVLRFTVSDYEGKTYYHIRIYVKSKEFSTNKDMYLPTKKGISFTLDEFPEFTKGLLSLKDYIDSKTSQTKN